jgi:tryptophan synthase beta chain
LKREDLCHTGAHKINNTIGQVADRRSHGKNAHHRRDRCRPARRRLGDGGGALRLECEVFMGAEDVRRQALNVFRMELLGAVVRVVESGSRTLKDAMNEALRDWIAASRRPTT